GDEFRDLRHFWLVPVPLISPEADTRFVGNSLNAFELEQGAAHRHLLVEPELDDLLDAVDLIAAAHDVDEDLRAIGLGLDEVGREIGRADRGEGAGPGAALRL